MTTTTTSRKLCGKHMLTVIMYMTGWIPWIYGQTVHISYGSNGSPQEGEIDYTLECIIANLPLNTSLAWSKDNQILFWSTGTVSDLIMTGDFTIKEYKSPQNNLITYFVLTILEVTAQHSGDYSCFIANGNILRYMVLQSSTVPVRVLNPDANPVLQPSLTGVEYFPSNEWPKCYPSSDVTALIYSNITIKCASVPGNPTVQVNLHDSKGQFVPESYINQTSPLIERIYTFEVMPSNTNIHFKCQIVRTSDAMSRRCDIGEINIRLFRESHIEVEEGSFYIFDCLARTSFNIEWLTKPEIPPLRVEEETNTQLLTIHNVQMSDNGTQVICKVSGYDRQDQIQLIVISPDMKTTVSSLIETASSSSQYASSTDGYVSTTSNTTTSDSNEGGGVLAITIIAAIGGGGGLLLIALILCIVAICCCRCRNRESDIKFEDGATTRISTGYMWDKELSHMVQESPQPSPKLTNNNHAHVRQVLKDPDESDPSMSPSLAYALANHSDDDLDSNDGDLKKPVSGAYETVDLNPAGRVLEHGASMHSNLYASTAIVASVPPISSNPSADFPPQYAVPDKNKYPSSRADDDATPTESPYVIVHPDPENPMVRASLRQRAAEGHVNAAYDTSEGFVENGIYEPAGR